MNREMLMKLQDEGVRWDVGLAERVHEACVQAALDGYERAAMSGLCREGSWEAAISAIRMVDLPGLLDLAE